MKVLKSILLAGALFALTTGAVWAHSFPAQETPAAGAELPTSPAEVAIRFDAPIEHLFAQLQVIGADGKDEAVSAPAIGPDGYTLVVKIPPLKPGDYQVKWAVVCIDTHHTNGSYAFTIAGSGA